MKQMNINEAFTLAQNYHAKNELSKAEQIYQTILSIDTLHAGAHHNMGLIHAVKGDAEKAIASFKRAVELDRTNAVYHNNIGETYRKLDQFEHAEFHLGAAVDLRPGYADALSNLGLLYAAKGQNDNAKLCFANALDADPKNIPAMINSGNLMRKEQLYEDAAECYEAVLNISPDNPAALKSAAYNYIEMGEYAPAAKYCSRLINGRPEMHRERVLLGLITLRNKDFRKGFQLLESRLKFQNILKGDTDSLWRGASLSGKTLCVYAETEGGGFDETILFSRYIFELAKYSPARVVFCVQPELKNLLSSNMPDFAEVTDEPFADFDTHSPLLSLPLVLNARAKTIPMTEGWLKANPEKTDKFAKLITSDKKRIGITSLSPDRANNIDISAFTPLSSEGLTLYYIGQTTPDEALPESIVNLSEHIHDYSDTAAAITNMDMVIGADSPEIHIAGAMGVKTALLINRLHNWQWFNAKTGKSSEWYSSVTFYIKEKGMTWLDVVTSIIR